MSLRKKHKRRKHVLNCKKHLDSLNSLHNKYDIVPADKAANVIVVCMKYIWRLLPRKSRLLPHMILLQGIKLT